MRAIVCTEYGPVDRLHIGELPDPEPGPGEVVIDVAAAALNFPDTLIIAGRYQLQPEPPFSPGFEATGTVTAVGDGVTLDIGKPVVAAATHGAFAERWRVPATNVLPYPDGLSLEQAAGFTIAYNTAFHTLRNRGRVTEGDVLLVLGAAGGVGSAAVELGKTMGATVIAAAGSEGKLEYAREVGADHTINYATSDLKAAVREITSGRGADVVYDPVGGSLSEPAFRSLAWRGRHLVIGFAAGEIPAIPLNLPLLKEASIVGVYWGDWLAKEPGAAAETITELYQMVATGAIEPRVGAVYALDDYADAFAELLNRTAKGRVLLRVAQ